MWYDISGNCDKMSFGTFVLTSEFPNDPLNNCLFDLENSNNAEAI